MPDEDGNSVPNGKVTNKDLWFLSTTTNGRIDLLISHVDAQTRHYDAGLALVNLCIENLRGAVNERLHEHEQRIDKLEQGFSLRTMLVQHSWKIATFVFMAAGALGGAISRFGLPWEWFH